MWHYYLYIIFLLIVSLLSGSCMPINYSYLKEGEYLLSDQYVVGNTKITADELEPYYLQSANRKLWGKFLDIPLWFWIYEFGLLSFNEDAIKKRAQRLARQYEKKLQTFPYGSKAYWKYYKIKEKKLEACQNLLKNGNFFMQMGEPPVIYDRKKRLATAKNLLEYLHSRGFFKAQVKSAVKIRANKAHVFYKITENEPFYLQEVRCYTSDSVIAKILEPYQANSLLKKGMPYEQDQLIAERERIYNLLLDNGFWEFKRQYIYFNVDTTSLDQQVILETVIALPEGKSQHPCYQIGKIDFIVERQENQDTTSENADIKLGDITFRHIKQDFNTNIISYKIPLKSGMTYRKQTMIGIQKKLINLDIFKNIYLKDSVSQAGELNTSIHVSLLDKFQIEQELGTGFTNNAALPFYQFSLKGRNLFKHLENIALKSQISVELAALTTKQKRRIHLKNLDVSMDLKYPQFLLPLSGKLHANLDQYNPITNLNIGVVLDEQPGYYSRKAKYSLTYLWQPMSIVNLVFTPLNLALTDFKLTKEFQLQLAKKKQMGMTNYKRYIPNFISFSSFKATIRQKSNNQKYKALELFLEHGGLFQNFFNFSKLISAKLMYYKYLKGSIILSQHIPLLENKNTPILAYQLYTGLLYPYNKDPLAPTEKYFFAGGSNSIRAWESRNLGPGSYKNDKKIQGEDTAGEVILQANVELRQKLVGILEGAAYIDVGNVWTIFKNDALGKDFKLDRFYKEFAVGIGLGLRLNFNFLILRLDSGIKLYDPAEPKGKCFLPEGFTSPIIHFGIGYPF